MEGSTEKSMSLATTVLVGLVVLGAAIFIVMKVLPLIYNSGDKIDTITTQVENVEYSAYNNTDVSGSEVISAINTKANENITVMVVTKSGSHSYNSASYNIKIVSDKDYIEPTAKFHAVVERTDNQTITGITFTQK